MNRLRYIALAAVLGCLVCPSLGMASIIDYTAVGYVIDKQNQILPISGDIYIDNQLRDWNGVSPGQPTEVKNEIGIFVYQYYIPSYSLRVGQYSLAGDRGSLYMPLFRSPTLDDWGIGDLMWFLEDGSESSQWKTWIGEHFTFFNADGTPQDFSHYGTLAATINLAALMFLSNDPILSEAPPFDLWLYGNDSSSPAPEPATVILLGAGLAGIAMQKRYRSLA